MVRGEVAIVGSCVTRDAFALVPDHDWTVTYYSARSGLASFMGRQTQELEVEYNRIPSSFQARMVRDDVEKFARRRLQLKPFDFLVYDLIDERFPLLEFKDGGLATESWEFTQLHADLSNAQRHGFLSDAHTARWEKGWTAFLGMLTDMGVRDRLRVHRAPWVTRVRGERQPAGDVGAIEASNRWLSARCQRMLNDLEPAHLIEVAEEHWAVDPGHRWGVTPFHYVPEYYASFLDALNATG